MLDEQRRQFFESGCGLLIGVADADRRPYGTRGWGARADPHNAFRMRVIVSGDDARLRDLLQPNAPIAVTGADVRTLRGLQVKGRVLRLDSVTRADEALMLRFCNEFFDTIAELDGIPRELLERIRPSSFMACEIELDAVFDQTPGPGAGRPAETAAR